MREDVWGGGGSGLEAEPWSVSDGKLALPQRLVVELGPEPHPRAEQSFEQTAAAGGGGGGDIAAVDSAPFDSQTAVAVYFQEPSNTFVAAAAGTADSHTVAADIAG